MLEVRSRLSILHNMSSRVISRTANPLNTQNWIEFALRTNVSESMYENVSIDLKLKILELFGKVPYRREKSAIIEIEILIKSQIESTTK